MLRKLKSIDKKKLVLTIAVGLVSLSTGVILSYLFGQDNADLSKSFEQDMQEVEYSPSSNDLDYIFRTPWPPTDAQKTCNERLEEDRKNPQLNELIGGAYCGATGEYVGNTASGRFIINRESLLSRLDTSQQNYNTQNCTTESIPFSTVREYVSTLLEGTQYTLAGIEGSKIYCDNKLVSYLPPYNKKIVIGTAEPFTPSIDVPPPPTYEPPSGPAYSYDEALSIAQNNCGAQIGSNSSAYWVCVDILMEDFGYPEYVPEFD